jgi:4-amino-4-deoxy-L-arabinose transferase-like glycosyltransferase
LGLALSGEIFFLLAWLGWLQTLPLIVLCAAAIIGGAWRGAFSWDWRDRALVLALLFIAPLFVVALQPPLAFDETLYHLPIVRSLATSGELRFLGELRFPLFPQLQELLSVPLFRIAGDVAPHLLSLVEVMTTAALMAAWGRRYDQRAGMLASALLIGSPLIVHLGTILYVEAGLMLFVAAAFYSLDVALTDSRRIFFLHSAIFLGAACSVKYLGGFFAAAALLIVLIIRRREALLYASAITAAALPTTLWLVISTGNPFFPFATSLFGRNDWTLDVVDGHPSGVVNALRVLWDVSFARERMNQQPPMTPLLIALVLLVAAAAVRERKARIVVIVGAAYLILFAFLPQDSRYLVALLPMTCVASAVIIATRWPRSVPLATFIGAAPGVAYVLWRLMHLGLPPVDAPARNALLTSRLPGYAALTRAGESRVYVCGAEQLNYYAAGRILGDFTGPHSYARVIDGTGAGAASTVAQRLRERRIDYLLIEKRHCHRPAEMKELQLTYDDGVAELWRVQPH